MQTDFKYFFTIRFCLTKVKKTLSLSALLLISNNFSFDSMHEGLKFKEIDQLFPIPISATRKIKLRGRSLRPKLKGRINKNQKAQYFDRKTEP